MRYGKAKILRGEFVAAAALALFISSPQASAQSDLAIEEITVTATKREENLQDVPISIGVVTGDFLGKFEVTDLGEFQNYVPGLQVQKTFGSWAVRVRGLGSGITNLAFDASVPVFNDGIYCARGKCLESAFLDVERIEVARGPQGALFGKSTMAGAISLTSARPTDTFDGQVRASYEMENEGYALSGHFSGPLSDTVRGRVAYLYEDVGGWVKNAFVSNEDASEERFGIRGTLEWDISDTAMLSLKVETGETEADGRSNQLVNPGLMSAISSDPSPEFNRDEIRRVSTGVGPEAFNDHEWTLATLKLDKDLGEHTLTGIIGYWDTETAWRLDVDGGPDYNLNTDLRDTYDQTTAELRLLSPVGQTVEYIVGAWYQQSDLHTQQFSPFSPGLANFFGGVILGVPPFLLPPASTGGVGGDRHIWREQDAFSVYGQMTWNVSDRFRIVADIRYTDETQDANGRAWSSTFPDGVNPVHSGQQYLFHFPDYNFFQSRKDDSTDPAIRFQLDATDNTVLYAGWSKGSKAGGLKANDQNIGTYTLNACADPTWCQNFVGQSTLTPAEMAAGITLQDGNGTFDYEDEEAESIEIGSKMNMLDGRATLNLALYTMQFDNLQTSSYDGTRFIINNASSAEVTGAEIEGVLQATENLRIDAAIAYVDATYDDFNQAQCEVDGDGNILEPGCVDGAADRSGDRLERVPELEANVNLDWHSELSNGLQLLASLSMYYSDEYFVRQDNSPHGKQDSFSRWDARVALAAADDRWEVGITGKNLSDELTVQHAYEILGDSFLSLSKGRTVTINGVYRF